MRANTVVSWVLIGIVTLLVFAPLSVAHAKLIKWVLDDVKYDTYDYSDYTVDFPPTRRPVPTTTVSGWFLYDAETRVISKWDVFGFVNPPTAHCLYYFGIECNSAERQTWGPGADVFAFVFDIGSPGSFRSLYLITPTLTDKGGVVPLMLRGSPPDGRTSELSSYGCCYGTEGGPLISGRLIGVEVPEPDGMVFLSLGLLSLFLLRTAKR